MKPAVAVLAVALFGYSAGLLYGQAASEMGAAAPQQAPSVPAPSPTAPTTASPAPAQQPGASSAPSPAGAEEQQLPETPAPLRVMVGKSILINTAEKLKRVSVTDPAVADAVVVTPTQLLIHGRSPGEVTLVIWDETERSRSFDLRVDVDVTAASEEIHDLFPDQRIRVTGSRNALVLSGHVDSKDTSDRAGALAGAFSKNVINVLTFGPVGEQAVMLEVKFAEVDRTALAQFGVNIFSTGAGNTFGTAQTGQFGGISGANVGAHTSDVQGGGAPGSTQATSEIGNVLHHQPASFGTNDLLNIFLFRTDANIGMLIRALKERNLLQILAEPNLVADNGKEASFLAGGEFPYPVIQPGTAGAVTIQFREFGVRLRFVPQIMPNGNIHLHVLPEVSSLDFANALTIQGFVVPALSTRRAETEFELRDGQSFVIAGLMDNRVTNIVNKVPGLGDIPILGELFRSTSLQKNKSELMVLVTARKIEPSMQPAPLPTMPKPFIEDKKFDNPKPGGSQ